MHRAICMTRDEHVYSTSCAGNIFEAGGQLSSHEVLRFCTWPKTIINGACSAMG